jgi:hypothetical protein
MGEEEGIGAAGADAEWSGYGLQPVYTITPKFSVGGRYEYFKDKDRAAMTPSSGLMAKDAYNITLTPTWKHSGNVTLRAEVRKDGWTTTGGLDKDSTTVGGKLIYTF